MIVGLCENCGFNMAACNCDVERKIHDLSDWIQRNVSPELLEQAGRHFTSDEFPESRGITDEEIESLVEYEMAFLP